MTHQQSIEQLQTLLSQTLSADSAIRREAEQHLKAAQKVPGHPLVVLRIVARSDGVDAAVRQAAAVHFKNTVKKGWDADAEDGNDGINISEDDRKMIKSHLVNLMCTVPPQIQAQCSEAISLIAMVDFPSNWDNLLSELVQQFNSPDPNIVNGVLLTASSIFKRFRYVERSDKLYSDIAYVLQRLQAPLLTLFKTMGQAVKAHANDVGQLRPRIIALRYICRIFYSLNWQDLPEYFEDHISEWMEEFATYLTYKNPLLTDEEEESEPSPIDNLQTAIVDNLYLYESKDEEPFIPFLPNFTALVWNLLLGVSSFSKHDILATTCIKFLSSLIGKLMHKHLFQEEGTLRQIISKIVIPNLMIREVDMEQFEDDPQEFIIGDIEGTDTESRRKRSQILLRAMCRQFDNETTLICSEHISSMISEFSAAPADKWIGKDAAIHLMLGISVKAESAHGVSVVSDKVNIMEFFTSNVLTELQDKNHSVRPMLKATAIKFVTVFRNQFSKEHMVALMPLFITHLGSPNVVVHTYSSIAIEKFLTCKDGVGHGKRQTKLSAIDLKPFLEPLFTGLFAIVGNADWNENEYAMKCIMRSLSSAKDDIINVTEIVLEKLNAALFVAAKNPRNPQYNHYMFESIAVLVKSVCAERPQHTMAFEKLLFPPFQTVLQLDVSEFTPYVFQILAQLLEFRPGNSGLGEAYTMLLPPLLTPTLWERKGNIPALIRLLQAYLNKGSSEIVTGKHFSGFLGVFQKLVATRSSEVEAFGLLGAITQYIPIAEGLQPHLNSLFQILLFRLQKGKTPRYVRLLTSFFAQFIGKNGFEATLNVWNEIQQGLGIMLLSQVWFPQLNTDSPNHQEAKIHVVGLTKVLCENSILLVREQHVWSQGLDAILKILTSSAAKFEAVDDNDNEDVEIGYDKTFSRLHFASKTHNDPFDFIKDPQGIFVTSLQQLYISHAGIIKPIIQNGFQSNPKLYSALELMYQKAGFQFT